MEQVIIALVSCVIPFIIMNLSVVLISWKERGRIESIEASAKGFKIQFCKSSRKR